MISQSLKVFVTNYVSSLAERSRLEKKGIKYGLDWVIYNLALAKQWTPVRLPFTRDFGAESPKAKTEPEFGIDASFLNQDGKILYIFVLKDEVLNNINWTGHEFLTDLQKASYPDLSDLHFKDVDNVKIILAFNKDEDSAGKGLFNRFVEGSQKRLKDGISLSFEPWNLDKIVKEVTEHLLTAEMLPQNLSGLLSYVCGLVAKVEFGTHEWENLVLPAWRNYLEIALTAPIDERKIRLIPMSLVIVFESLPGDRPVSQVAWIELIEWGMVGLWKIFPNMNKAMKEIVVEIWTSFYISELERYIESARPALTTENGLASRHHGGIGGINAINDGYVAYWTLSRLGLLSICPQEVIDTTKPEGHELVGKMLRKNVEILSAAIRFNPGCFRPLLDIDHITIYLVWLVFWQMGRTDEIEAFLSELENRLLMRRTGNAHIPFLEGRNRLDLVAEYVATGEKPFDYIEDSSYFILMVMELCFSLPDEERDSLLKRYYERIVLGLDANGERLVSTIDHKELPLINLLWWSPPESWSKEILNGPMLNNGITKGVSVSLSPSTDREKKASEIVADFVSKSRQKLPFKFDNDVPRSVLILCCLKYQCPLPSEFWRELIFPLANNNTPNK